MTSRERLLAAANGQPADQKPIIVWPHDEMYSDAAIVTVRRLANAATSPRGVLVEILSPFAASLARGLKLNDLFRQDPEGAEKELQSLVTQTELEIEMALNAKADGIFYRLQGVEPEYCTPMQYGGQYLETDRELLEAASSAKLNVLFVEGGPDLYLDFVSDLPAQVFAWDKSATGIEVETVRKLRSGALATADPEAEILFGSNYGLLRNWVQAAAEVPV